MSQSPLTWPEYDRLLQKQQEGIRRRQYMTDCQVVMDVLRSARAAHEKQIDLCVACAFTENGDEWSRAAAEERVQFALVNAAIARRVGRAR